MPSKKTIERVRRQVAREDAAFIPNTNPFPYTGKLMPYNDTKFMKRMMRKHSDLNIGHFA